MFSTKRTNTGYFICLWNDLELGMGIFNSSAGIDGRGGNVYGIEYKGKIVHVGSLQKTKKTAALICKRDFG